jgi:hypothetical protein
MVLDALLLLLVGMQPTAMYSNIAGYTSLVRGVEQLGSIDTK